MRTAVAVAVLAATASVVLVAAAPASAATPTVSIDQAVSQPDPTSVSPIAFTAEFSEPVTGFTAADVDLSASTAGGALSAVVTGGPKTYTVSVSGMTTTGKVVVSIPAGAAHNGSNVTSAASTSTDHSVTWDAPVVPTPTVSIDQAVSQPDPTSVSPIAFTAEFSEPVTGFTAADVDLSASTAGGALSAVVTGGPKTYTVSVSGMTTTGKVVVSIPAGAAHNGSNKTSAASTSTDNKVEWLSSGTSPTVTIEQATGQADPASVSPILFTATFSRAVSGFTGSDVSFSGSTAGGALVATVGGGPTVYTVSVAGMTTAGTVLAAIPAGAASDGSSNLSTASTSTDSRVAWLPPAKQVSSVAPSIVVLSKCKPRRPCTASKGDGALPLSVSCQGALPCAGDLTIVGKSGRAPGAHPSSQTRRGPVLGEDRFNLAAGAKKVLRVPLTVAAGRLLAGRPRVRATLTVTLGSATYAEGIVFRGRPAHRRA